MAEAIIGLLETESSQLNSMAKEMTIRDSEIDRLMVGMVLDIESIKALVIKYQNVDRGFYLHDNFVALHDVIFESSHPTITDLWRMLKLINFGDEYIPTGLVFDSLVTLFNIEVKAEECEATMRRIFFQFIEINGKVLSSKERDDIEFLRGLKKVIEGYREMIRQKVADGFVVSPTKGDQKRYQELHNLHGVYMYKRNLKKLKAIDDEVKDCSFEPQLFQSRKHVESRYLTSTRRHDNDYLEQQQLFETKIFRATPIPSYPQNYPKGYTPHVNRLKQYKQTKHQNSLDKPIVIPPTMEQFSIERRDKERKRNGVKNRPVLFLIEAEVGKRRFWIKVREGMTEEQVVKQIEMLAGFEDKEIAAVVEQYFINYFRKTHQIEI